MLGVRRFHTISYKVAPRKRAPEKPAPRRVATSASSTDRRNVHMLLVENSGVEQQLLLAQTFCPVS